MKLRKPILAFTGATLVLSLAGAVLADDVMNLPASMCRPQDSGSLVVKANGEIENQTAWSVSALCPVERKWLNGAASTSLSGKIWALDQSSTADICCRAVSRNPGGGNTVGSSACTSGNGASYQGLDVPEITDGTTFSHFYFECTVPAPSAGKNSGLSTFRAIQK